MKGREVWDVGVGGFAFGGASYQTSGLWSGS